MQALLALGLRKAGGVFLRPVSAKCGDLRLMLLKREKVLIYYISMLFHAAARAGTKFRRYDEAADHVLTYLSQGAPIWQRKK